jgi:hypothetical protein
MGRGLELALTLCRLNEIVEHPRMGNQKPKILIVIDGKGYLLEITL